MGIETLENETAQMLSAIEICIDKKFAAAAVILMYSTIDSMAWLNRDETHVDVTRQDFISWVETFLLPGSGLSCTGIDLYAARCSTLHSYSAESKLSREGTAHMIFYAWGPAQEQDLQELIDWANTHDAIAVHVKKLFAALKVGVAKFMASARNDDRVKTRTEKRLMNMPAVKLNR